MEIACQSSCLCFRLTGKMLGIIGNKLGSYSLCADKKVKNLSKIEDFSTIASDFTERTDIKLAITGNFKIHFID
jgi:hypothetical protein